MHINTDSSNEKTLISQDGKEDIHNSIQPMKMCTFILCQNCIAKAQRYVWTEQFNRQGKGWKKWDECDGYLEREEDQ